MSNRVQLSAGGEPQGVARTNERRDPASFRAVRLGGSTHATVTRRPDGALHFQSTEALLPYPATLSERLVYWAEHRPQQTFAAQRGPDGTWRRITYAEMLLRVTAIAESLALRDLSPERPVAILSGNDLEHLQLSLAAMWAGIPVCPVSPGYSTRSADFGRLRHALGVVTPGLVFASHAEGYATAIEAVVPRDTEVVLTHGGLPDRPVTAFARLTQTPGGVAAARAHAAVTPDTIAKFLFTSGSTTLPKAVVTTQRMLCANQQMILQCLQCLGDEPPVLVDWLPWHHTFGGSHNVGIVLYNGGTLFIDEGKPGAPAFETTLRNLREIAPTIYFNVPKAWEDLAAALETDATLRQVFFSKVRLLFYSGASLSQSVWDRLDRVAEAAVGERIRMITGLGMTETSPSSLFVTGAEVYAGYVGLPAPGCEVKLVPAGAKSEARFRGPHVMPGYWRDPGQSAAAFDAEGYYCTGDALKLVDAEDPDRGLFFDGRITEDFKLATGSFVSVGALVRAVVAAGAPYVRDVVLCGMNQNVVGALIFPHVESCRTLSNESPDAPLPQVLRAAPVREFFQAVIDRLAAASTGSSNRIERAVLLTEPPAFDEGEITDKGSINQRAVLTRRAALVEALYSDSLPEVIRPRARSS
jgi:feruloyl-CoA synthase